MTQTISLKIIYSITALIHILGIGGSFYAILDANISVVKLTINFLSLCVLFSLLCTDVLLLHVLSRTAHSSFPKVMHYLDSFAAFTFAGMLLHVDGIQFLHLISTLGERFSCRMKKWLFRKLVIFVVIYFVGLILCNITEIENCQYFVPSYFYISSILHIFVYILSKRFLNRIKVRLLTSYNRGSTPTIHSHRILVRQNGPIQEESRGPHDLAKEFDFDYINQEVRFSLYSLSVLTAMSTVSSLILLPLYKNNTSFVSKMIISIPWKVTAGIYCCTFGSELYIKWRKIR